jgi:hypothetical protein
MTETLDPKIKLYMQFALTLIVVGFMGAAWWAGKVPAEAALPVITGLIGLWLPGPLSASIPRGMSLVPTEHLENSHAQIAQAMSMPGRRTVTHPAKELQDARNSE